MRLAIVECEVTVSYSDYDFVIATDHAFNHQCFEEDFSNRRSPS